MDTLHSEDFEPVFHFGEKKKFSLPDNCNDNKVSNYFEYHLKQNPKNLCCHLQRIQYALKSSQNNQLFVSLCDLFIILGSLGQPLRQRLLRLSKKILTIDQINLLIHIIANKTFIKQAPNDCCFKAENTEFIEICHRETHAYSEDTLKTADSYIENSQFDSAIEYMFNQLSDDPDNQELTVKLIDLYKAMSYSDQFNNAYQKFSDNLLTAQDWDDGQQFFVSQ